MSVLELIWNNREWLFSGVGIPIVGYLIYRLRLFFILRNQKIATGQLENDLNLAKRTSIFFPEKTIINLEKLYSEISARRMSDLQIDELNRLGRVAKIQAEGLVREVYYWEHENKIVASLILNPEKNEKEKPSADIVFLPEERERVVAVCIGDWIIAEGNLRNKEKFRCGLEVYNANLICIKKGNLKFPDDFIMEKKT